MYPSRKVGKNKTIPVADKQELTEDNIQVAAIKYIAGEANPLESDSEREEEMKPADISESAKTKAARRKALKYAHKKDDHKGPETASQMNMYLKIKQMSLFPSIY